MCDAPTFSDLHLTVKSTTVRSVVKTTLHYGSVGKSIGGALKGRGHGELLPINLTFCNVNYYNAKYWLRILKKFSIICSKYFKTLKKFPKFINL